MINFFTVIGCLIIFLIFVVLIRVIKGPSIVDRMMAVNVIGTKTTILLIIIGFIYDRIDMFIDLAITYAILNFISSLVAANYIKRKKDTIGNKFIPIREDNLRYKDTN